MGPMHSAYEAGEGKVKKGFFHTLALKKDCLGNIYYRVPPGVWGWGEGWACLSMPTPCVVSHVAQ